LLSLNKWQIDGWLILSNWLSLCNVSKVVDARLSLCRLNTAIYVLQILYLFICCLLSLAVVGMDAELAEWLVDDVVQCEERIVSQSRALLSADDRAQVQSEVDELNERLRPLGVQTRLVVVERANSLALYFICMTLSALMSLRDQWRSRQLRDILQSLFIFLSGATRTVHVKRLIWPLSHYQRCLDFFSSVQGKQTI